MKNFLNDTSKIITARVAIPINTTSASPVSLKLSSQMPILKSLSVMMYSLAGAVSPIESGWKVSSGGIDIIPAMGSSDGLTVDNFAPILDSFPFESGIIDYQISGPPYELDFKFYNTDAAAIAYYFIVAKFGAKIELPNAPIQNDAKPAPAKEPEVKGLIPLVSKARNDNRDQRK